MFNQFFAIKAKLASGRTNPATADVEAGGAGAGAGVSIEMVSSPHAAGTFHSGAAKRPIPKVRVQPAHPCADHRASVRPAPPLPLRRFGC
jgi:hypothetical protein